MIEFIIQNDINISDLFSSCIVCMRARKTNKCF